MESVNESEQLEVTPPLVEKMPLEQALENGPWRPREYKRYTMKDVRRAKRKHALIYLEWKILRKYTWRQRRFIRQQFETKVVIPVYIGKIALKEVKNQLR